MLYEFPWNVEFEKQNKEILVCMVVFEWDVADDRCLFYDIP